MNKKYEIYALLLVIYSAVHLMVVFAHDNPIYIRINSLFFFISVLCFLFTWYKNSNNVIKIDLKIRDLEIKVRSLNQCIDEKDAFYNSLINKTNQAAIQIANNRGALAKKTRAMEMRTLTVRNKVEDQKVVPVYVETSRMLADIGTKALDPARFQNLRDAMTGYSAWQAMKEGNLKDFALMMIRMKRNKWM